MHSMRRGRCNTIQKDATRRNTMQHGDGTCPGATRARRGPRPFQSAATPCDGTRKACTSATGAGGHAPIWKWSCERWGMGKGGGVWAPTSSLTMTAMVPRTPLYFGTTPGRTTWAISRVLVTSRGQFSMGCPCTDAKEAGQDKQSRTGHTVRSQLGARLYTHRHTDKHTDTLVGPVVPRCWLK